MALFDIEFWKDSVAELRPPQYDSPNVVFKKPITVANVAEAIRIAEQEISAIPDAVGYRIVEVVRKHPVALKDMRQS